MSTEKSIKWLAASATLVYIAQEVAGLDPRLPGGYCMFCRNLVDDSVETHDDRCAWRHARDFMGEPWNITIARTE